MFKLLSFVVFVIASGFLFSRSASAQVWNGWSETRTCGPYADTYLATASDPAKGSGIRCVKWSDGSLTRRNVPALAWYGEGRWGTGRYRHVGQAKAVAPYKGHAVYQGYLSDITGNGEDFAGNYPGTFRLTQVDANTIQLTGALQETWRRAPSVTVDFQPLPPVTQCGRFFTQYQVQSIDDHRLGKRPGIYPETHTGLRCVLKNGFTNTTWFGIGNWDGNTYSHLATRSTQGWGASDLCLPGDAFCQAAGYGDIKYRFSSIYHAPIVEGWNEVWLK